MYGECTGLQKLWGTVLNLLCLPKHWLECDLFPSVAVHPAQTQAPLVKSSLEPWQNFRDRPEHLSGVARSPLCRNGRVSSSCQGCEGRGCCCVPMMWAPVSKSASRRDCCSWIRRKKIQRDYPRPDWLQRRQDRKIWKRNGSWYCGSGFFKGYGRGALCLTFLNCETNGE